MNVKAGIQRILGIEKLLGVKSSKISVNNKIIDACSCSQALFILRLIIGIKRHEHLLPIRSERHIGMLSPVDGQALNHCIITVISIAKGFT
jgi:hypothetical protein